MCQAFSSWQRLNKATSKDPDKYSRMRSDGLVHLQFACELYKRQAAAGRLVLHEHPAQADSWAEESVHTTLLVTLHNIMFIANTVWVHEEVLFPNRVFFNRFLCFFGSQFD